MREPGEVLAEHAQAQRRTDPVADGDEFLRLVDEAEMAAATDERIVVAGIFREGRNRRPQVGQRLFEAPGSEEREAVNGGVEAGKRVERR